MNIFARSSRTDLEREWDKMEDKPDYRVLRRPETGMIMVRGRTGGTGRPFNIGETTVTRCSVRMPSGEIGTSYILGTSGRKAELAALLDGILQTRGNREPLCRAMISRLEDKLRKNAEQEAVKAASTKVSFFTMKRGE